MRTMTAAWVGFVVATGLLPTWVYMAEEQVEECVVRGQVINHLGGSGIPAVDIEIVEATGAVIARTATDANGFFEVAVCSTDPMMIRFRRPGFLRDPEKHELEAEGAVVELKLALLPTALLEEANLGALKTLLEERAREHGTSAKYELDLLAGFEVDKDAIERIAALVGVGQDEIGEDEWTSHRATEMEDAWRIAMAPGAQHEMLAASAGEWNVTITPGIGPDTEAFMSEPIIANGTAVRTTELGGRVMVEVIELATMGEPVQIIIRTGYNAEAGEWWSTWTDNMSTGLTIMTGTYDEESKTWTWNSESVEAMSGGPEKMKMMVRKVGENKEVVEIFQVDPDGEMRKAMEIIYTR